MYNFKHTPGPWNCKGYPTVSAGKGKGMITKVLERFMNKEEREANARLIAAAPELLDMLVELLPELGRFGMQDKFDKTVTLIDKVIGDEEGGN